MAVQFKQLGVVGQSQGDVAYFNGTDWVRLPAGTSGEFLQTLGAVSNPQWAAATAPAVTTTQWKLNGKITVSTQVDGAFVVPRDGTITRVTLWRGTAGAAGSTVVDLNINGTSAYPTATKPTVTQAAGDNDIDVALPDTTSLSQDDLVTMDVDSIETGNPLDLTLTVEIEYS